MMMMRWESHKEELWRPEIERVAESAVKGHLHTTAHLFYGRRWAFCAPRATDRVLVWCVYLLNGRSKDEWVERARESGRISIMPVLAVMCECGNGEITLF